MARAVTPPRRLLIVHSGADLYGSDLVCLRVASGAAAAGWDVEVMIPRHGDLHDALGHAGIVTHVLDPIVVRRADLRGGRAAGAMARWARQYGALRRFSTAHRFDLVHSNTSVVLGGLWLARRWDVGHVSHVHEIWPHRALVSGVERLLARSDAIICPSMAARDQFRLPACRARCRVVHSGVDVPSDLVGVVPLERAVPRIICVGRMSHPKGQDVLVGAAHRLAATGRRVDVHLVGDAFGGQVRHEARLHEQIRRLHLSDRVHFHGERRDALDLVAGSDIFVLPSRSPESFGMALVEAMALERPVVASAAGGPREIVLHADNGLLVRPGSEAQLADALHRLLDSPAWSRSLGRRAGERARDFTVGGMVAGVLGVYDDVTRRRDCSPASRGSLPCE